MADVLRAVPGAAKRGVAWSVRRSADGVSGQRRPLASPEVGPATAARLCSSTSDKVDRHPRGPGTPRTEGAGTTADRCLREGSRESGPRLKQARVDGHLAQARSRRVEDRVRNRRHDGRRPGFAEAAWRLGALHHVDLDDRHLVHPQHPVRVEVPLLDAAVAQRNLAVQRGRSAKAIPLWTWACTVSELTAMPMSSAHTTRCRRTSPSSETSTSATCAIRLPNAFCSDTPRPRPFGSAWPQPDFYAAKSRTARARGFFSSSARR